MKYLGKLVNGFDTRNNFIRSIDFPNAPTFEAALHNYNKAWFSSTKKQYLNEAFKNIIDKQSIFWPKHVFNDMLEEILVDNTTYDDVELARDIDVLSSKFTVFTTKRKTQPISREDMISAIKSFERKYTYPCPDSYKNAWMNNGAYISLCYEIKYKDFIFDGFSTQQECLDALKNGAMKILAESRHTIDTDMFRICYNVFKANYSI